MVTLNVCDPNSNRSKLDLIFDSKTVYGQGRLLFRGYSFSLSLVTNFNDLMTTIRAFFSFRV